MKRIVVTAMLTLGALPVRAADPWTRGEIAAEATFVALVALDYGQTSWAMRAGLPEQNPLLGEHPSRAKLGAACLASAGLHVTIAHYLPRDWRRVWQVISIAVEGGNVGLNFAIVGGVRLAF